MISWIVASHDPTVLHSNLLPTLDWSRDELVVCWDAPSIAAAYNEGQARAKFPLRCYVHHDVAVLDLPALRAALLEAVTRDDVGMVGVVGSRTPVLPWWDGETLGGVFDTRIGALDFGAGGPCAVLDGLLLATVHDVAWDETIPGWHGYDFDACMQMTARGLHNWCLSRGVGLLRHNATSSTDPDRLPGWADALDRLREKWRPPGG